MIDNSQNPPHYSLLKLNNAKGNAKNLLEKKIIEKFFCKKNYTDSCTTKINIKFLFLKFNITNRLFTFLISH